MAKPQILQKLSHDKILTQKNFPLFVETYNYIADRVENLKGDYDENQLAGNITVDNSDPEHPVIRFIPGSQVSGTSGTPSVWELSSGENSYALRNCTVRLARSYFFFPDQTLQKTLTADHFILLGIDHTIPPQIHLSCTDVPTGISLLSGGNYLSNSVQPLYCISNGTISVDYRPLLNIQAYDNRQVEYNPPWEV